MLSLDFLDDVRRMNKRQLYYQVLNFGMIVSSALMIWKGLMVITGSESPIVVVLSGSMEPAFHRGDLLFLTNRVEDPIRVGEIVVFRIEGREIPIVHRVLKIHEKQNGHIKFLTKGDNNAVDDRGLYKQGQHWLEKKDVVGRARGFVPYIGIVTILMNDYPKFKYAVLFLLGLFVLVHRRTGLSLRDHLWPLSSFSLVITALLEWMPMWTVVPLAFFGGTFQCG
ncbi:signal peptidase complex catalytic subunit SEC11A-like protein [Cricetulus griseus]|uniref:Signal peptidase complex catalytic subunit SEC11 n=1 Tax=Cricetulus griseus TaxID=10029 RepID=A0A061IBG6_CRIGR|nr:signal peptidase complex catalytic subunit SEC11A-like protein [Cricetulus griseus]